MIGIRGKEYWSVIVVDECLFAGGLRVCKLLGMELSGIVFVENFVTEKKLWGIFVVMGMHLDRMGVVFGGVVVGYLVAFEERHL